MAISSVPRPVCQPCIDINHASCRLPLSCTKFPLRSFSITIYLLGSQSSCSDVFSIQKFMLWISLRPRTVASSENTCSRWKIIPYVISGHLCLSKSFISSLLKFPLEGCHSGFLWISCCSCENYINGSVIVSNFTGRSNSAFLSTPWIFIRTATVKTIPVQFQHCTVGWAPSIVSTQYLRNCLERWTAKPILL